LLDEWSESGCDSYGLTVKFYIVSCIEGSFVIVNDRLGFPMKCFTLFLALHEGYHSDCPVGIFVKILMVKAMGFHVSFQNLPRLMAE